MNEGVGSRSNENGIRPSRRSVHTPDSQLRHPGQFVTGMIRDLVAARELAWRLFVRNIKARYRQTMLGAVWALLPPLVTAGVFVFLQNSGVIGVGDTPVPYPLYVFTGTILWQTFLDALFSPLRMMNQSREMLAKINFPREALVLAGGGEVLLDFLVRLATVPLVFMWFGFVPPWSVAAAPLAGVALAALGITIGLALTPLGILYRDVERGLMVVGTVWFFITPVAYPLPESGPGSVLSRWNPVAPLLETGRQWMTEGPVMPMSFVTVLAAVALALLVAWSLYRVALPHLVARMGS